MKFSTREDIEASADTVFDAVADFDSFERLLLRRGADVIRLDSQKQKSVGMCWDVGFKFRGRNRKARATVMQFEPSQGMLIASESGGVDAELTVSIVQLSAKRTRLLVALDLKPKTLSARLLIQSMKLAKGSLTRKYKDKVAEFAADIESEAKAAA
ncbi:MAG: SRPBCC family protein [Planktomarina sp.]